MTRKFDTAMLPGKLKSPRTPTLDKIAAHHKESQAIGEFLEWLPTAGIHLAEYVEIKECPCDGGSFCPGSHWQPVYRPITTLLAEYFEIDEEKAEKERCALLKSLQKEAKA